MWLHAVALAVVLAAFVPFVGTQSFFSADEGAAVAQATNLSNGDGWTMVHPFPAADPSGKAFPLELSDRRGDQYAPFVKHPLYAVLLAGADLVGGRTAMIALSIAGTWLAALFGALLTRHLDPRPGVDALALWLLGLASPLVFDSYVLIAHTLGAACVAFAALWFIRVVEGRTSMAVGAAYVGAAVVAAALLRSEGLLLAVGLAAAVAVLAWRRRRWLFGAFALVPLVAAGVAAVVERRWMFSIMGGSTTGSAPVGMATRGGVFEHLHSFLLTVVVPSYGANTAAVLVLAGSMLTIGAGLVIVRKPEDAEGPIVLLGAAVACGVARLFFAPEPVSGLLIAFPALLFAAVLASRRKLVADDRVVALVIAAAVFAVLVLVTQYSVGGAGEWGGRYFAIGLPLVVPVAAVAIAGMSARVSTASVRTISVLIALAWLFLPVLALRTLRSYHDFGDRLVTTVATTAAHTPAGDGGLPVVISTDGATARYAVDDLADGRWLTVDVENLGPYATRLTELGIQSFTLVTRKPEGVANASGYRVTSTMQPVPGWYVLTLTSH